MHWALYALFAALSLLDIVLVFAGGVAWFGSGTIGLAAATVVTLLGPALVYSSASGSARGTRLGSASFGPAYAIGIALSTFAAATAVWMAVTDATTPTAARIIAAILALAACAGLAAAPGALRLQVQRLEPGGSSPHREEHGPDGAD